MLFECMRRLGVYPPSAVVKVGDTVVDIQEGKKAGAAVYKRQLMIHINILVSHFKGLNRLIEQKDTISPRGRAPTSVTANSLKVWRKPSFRAPITV